ncbi:MAG TPA: hypothetical protein VNO17_01575 [Actinomycetota bacterium]|nr:hypothetical protein [Actinomycetota bacterium]
MSRGYWEIKRAWLAGEEISEEERVLIGATARPDEDEAEAETGFDSWGDPAAIDAREARLGLLPGDASGGGSRSLRTEPPNPRRSPVFVRPISPPDS